MIGAVGPDERVAALEAAVGGAEVCVGEPGTILAAGPDVVVAIGDDAVIDLVEAGAGGDAGDGGEAVADAPILPVEGGPGLDSVSLDRATTILGSGEVAGLESRKRPVLASAVGDEAAGRALFDVMLVTSEPARISEYSITAAEWSDRFRADGLVVSTPAGSQGYARAVGGPVLDAGSGSLAVVPVAAFALRSTVHVVGDDGALSVGVERDEGDVSLLVDGRDRRVVPPDRTVSVRVAGHVRTVVDVDPADPIGTTGSDEDAGPDDVRD